MLCVDEVPVPNIFRDTDLLDLLRLSQWSPFPRSVDDRGTDIDTTRVMTDSVVVF